jgi:4-amino-4-deoxy-L-arabinose transferase-like glycosyltransferase
MMNALIGALVAPLVYLIAKTLWDGRHGVVAGALPAVFPPLIALTGSLLSEPLFIVLELLLVLAVLRYQAGTRRLPYAALIGLLCGAAALTRSVGLLLAVAAAVGIFAAPRSIARQALTSVAVMLAAMCLVIAPWAIRNASAFHGAFVPISTQDGITAAGTYDAQAAAHGPLYAVWRPPYFVPAFRHLFDDSINEARMDSILRSDALSFAVAHPGYVLATIGLDSLRLAYIGPGHAFADRQWYYEMGVPRKLRLWISISGGVLIAVALLGAITAFVRLRPARRRQIRSSARRTWFVWLAAFFMYASVVPIHGAFRYRAPIDPFILMLAAHAITSARRTVKRQGAL